MILIISDYGIKRITGSLCGKSVAYRGGTAEGKSGIVVRFEEGLEEKCLYYIS